MSRAIFQKVFQSEAAKGGDNFRDGRGVVVVTQCICKAMNEGTTFVMRTKVLESESKGDLDPVSKQPVQPNAVGSKPGWVQKIDKHKSAAGNVKALILAADNLSESQLDEGKFIGLMELICGPEQALRGYKLRYETAQKQIKGGPNAGKWMTIVNWSHLPQTDEEKSALRAELDKTDPLSL